MILALVNDNSSASWARFDSIHWNLQFIVMGWYKIRQAKNLNLGVWRTWRYRSDSFFKCLFKLQHRLVFPKAKSAVAVSLIVTGNLAFKSTLSYLSLQLMVHATWFILFICRFHLPRSPSPSLPQICSEKCGVWCCISASADLRMSAGGGRWTRGPFEPLSDPTISLNSNFIHPPPPHTFLHSTHLLFSTFLHVVTPCNPDPVLSVPAFSNK